MIEATNNKKKFSSISSTECFIDPSLFSKAVRNTRLSEESFLTIVEFMTTNGIPVLNDFLLNAFEGLLCNENNINSLLDIVDYFSEPITSELNSLSGEYWRCLMNTLLGKVNASQNEYDFLRQYSLSNRNSLLFSLFHYFRKDDISL